MIWCQRSYRLQLDNDLIFQEDICIKFSDHLSPEFYCQRELRFGGKPFLL